ncbi:L-fuculokinase [Phycisphaerales bacterium AB-hyl4]|uniref:L-fuculokinase n=1 Tax=Natronomicrosphaera hydrolytica TaxID=3242702 RepID=A0ABV4U4F1_9BACT
MTVSTVLTFDLGTTLFKACLFDDAGEMLALARVPTPTDTPRPGWAQIEPTRFEAVLAELSATLREQDASAFSRLRGISFSTQTNSVLLLDEADRPVSPIVLWSDRRASELAEAVGVLADQPGYAEETGVTGVSPNFAVAKLMWLQRHEPEAWGRARKWRLIGDQLAWWLTGRHVTEAGAAGLTGLLDVHQLRWRAGALEAAGLSELEPPTPMYAGADLGVVDAQRAAALGLPSDCRVMLGCLDQYAGALGAGNVGVGGLSETTGTVLATVSLAESFDASPGAGVVQGPAWRAGLWWRMCFGSASANLFEAMRNAEADDPTFTMLEAEAAAVPAGADGLRLDVEESARTGTPTFEGLAARHTRGHRVRALFEGVARALSGQVAALEGGRRPLSVHSVGGASRSRLWLQIKADALGVPIITIDTPEPTSLGAAALALAGLSDDSLATVARRVTHVREVIEPTARAGR